MVTENWESKTDGIVASENSTYPITTDLKGNTKIVVWEYKGKTFYITPKQCKLEKIKKYRHKKKGCSFLIYSIKRGIVSRYKLVYGLRKGYESTV